MESNEPIVIKNPGRMLTLTYVASLSVIALLSIVVHFMLDEVISEQNNTGKVVNVSGQQRMLSQRASMFAIDYIQSGSISSKRLSMDAVEKMKENHAFLISAHKSALENGELSPLSTTLQAMYFSPPSDVDKKITVFENEIARALSLEEGPQDINFKSKNLKFLKLAESELLAPLHSIVGQYEKESLEKVNDLRTAQNVVLGIIILTILIEAFFIFRPMVAKVSRYATKLQRDANFDFLSGLLNRRAFNIIAQQSISASHRYNRQLSIIMFDIDFFKRINDAYGHEVGDSAIKHVSNILDSYSRESDCVARIGGEEFVLLLSDTGKEGAEQLANKLRKKVESTPLIANDDEIHITLSGGVAVVKAGDRNIESALSDADEALYRAKKDGRNQVQLA